MVADHAQELGLEPYENKIKIPWNDRVFFQSHATNFPQQCVHLNLPQELRSTLYVGQHEPQFNKFYHMTLNVAQ